MYRESDELIAERWKHARSLFDQACELPPTQRPQFLACACDGDDDLRVEVETLLAADEGTGCLDRPPVETVISAFASEHPKRAVGMRVGVFRLESWINSGGMGDVYRAVRDDGRFEQTVAIKILKRGLDTDALIQRFRLERRTLALLEHPNIARLIDGGVTEDGRPYLAMEHVPGTPIDEYCDEHRLTILERIRLFLPVCAAVQYAHQHLIVHRDIKPRNIQVGTDGTPKLLDFGIAKILSADPASPATLTLPGEHRLMTPSYASPEQLRGEPVTTASDVYSLGIVLYELLTGTLPRQGDTDGKVGIEHYLDGTEPELPSKMIRHQRRAPSQDTGKGTARSLDDLCRVRKTNPESLGRSLKGDLDNVLLMALRKDPTRRYASAEQLAADIERYLSCLPVVARKDTLAYRTAKFVRRNRKGVFSVFVMVTLLSSGVVSTAWQARRARSERDQALVERRRSERVTAFLQDTLLSASPERNGADTTLFELLEETSGRIETELAGDRASQAKVRYAIGATYASLAVSHLAVGHLRTALSEYRALYGNKDSNVADCLVELGVLLTKETDMKSVALLREALQIRVGMYGADHVLVADTERELARSLWKAHRPPRSDEANALLQDARRIYVREFGEKSLSVATWTHYFGGLRASLGHPEEAILHYEKARRLFGELGCDACPHHVALLRDLGWALYNANRRDEAVACMDEYAKVMRRAYGSTWQQDGQWQMVQLCASGGTPRQTLENFHAWIVDVSSEHEAQSTGGNSELAELMRALSNVTPQNPAGGTAEIYRDLLTLLWKRDALPGLRAPASMYHMGKAMADIGEYEQAGTLFLACLELHQKIRPGDVCGDTAVLLGRCLIERGMYPEAERYVSLGLTKFRTSFGPDSDRTQFALRQMVDLYRRWDKEVKANEYIALLTPTAARP